MNLTLLEELKFCNVSPPTQTCCQHHAIFNTMWNFVTDLLLIIEEYIGTPMIPPSVLFRSAENCWRCRIHRSDGGEQKLIMTIDPEHDQPDQKNLLLFSSPAHQISMFYATKVRPSRSFLKRYYIYNYLGHYCGQVKWSFCSLRQRYAWSIRDDKYRRIGFVQGSQFSFQKWPSGVVSPRSFRVLVVPPKDELTRIQKSDMVFETMTEEMYENNVLLNMNLNLGIFPTQSVVSENESEEVQKVVNTFQTLRPFWHTTKNSFMLHFHNHLPAENSEYNFKLVQDDNPKKPTVLQFAQTVGKQGEEFVMEFQAPFSAFQAFAITLVKFLDES